LRDLAGAPAEPLGTAAPEAADGGLAERIRSLPPADAETLLIETVRTQTAFLLGRDEAGPITSDTAFSELGIDSLMAVELRNNLAAITGLKLPATLVFDHPNPAAVARFLTAGLTGGGPRTPADRLTKEIEELGARLDAVFRDLAETDRAAVVTALGELQRRAHAVTGDGSSADVIDRINSASAGELLSLLDKELG
jgi:acyl carrier protein